MKRQQLSGAQKRKKKQKADTAKEGIPKLSSFFSEACAKKQFPDNDSSQNKSHIVCDDNNSNEIAKENELADLEESQNRISESEEIHNEYPVNQESEKKSEH